MKFYQKSIAIVTTSCLLLCSCAHPDQNTYGDKEVGHDAVIFHGRVKSARQVDIKAQNTGTGAALGAVGGGVAGSTIGSGRGSVIGILAGAVIGGVAGAAAEQALKDRQGIEYIIKISETGETRSVVQNIAKTETPIAKGQCVMLQVSGSYQRVLPDDDEDDCPAPVVHKQKHVKTVIKHHEAATEVSDDPNE